VPGKSQKQQQQPQQHRQQATASGSQQSIAKVTDVAPQHSKPVATPVQKDAREQQL